MLSDDKTNPQLHKYALVYSGYGKTLNALQTMQHSVYGRLDDINSLKEAGGACKMPCVLQTMNLSSCPAWTGASDVVQRLKNDRFLKELIEQLLPTPRSNLMTRLLDKARKCWLEALRLWLGVLSQAVKANEGGYGADELGFKACHYRRRVIESQEYAMSRKDVHAICCCSSAEQKVGSSKHATRAP